MNDDKVLKLSTTHSDEDALNKAKHLIKDVTSGKEHVLFTDLDEPENGTEYTLEYSEDLSNALLDEIKKPQYTNQLILTEAIIGIEEDGVSTYEKATKTLAAPPGFDDTSSDYDEILNQLNQPVKPKPKRRRKAKRDPFSLGTNSSNIEDNANEISNYQNNNESQNHQEQNKSNEDVTEQQSDHQNEKSEDELVLNLIDSLLPTQSNLMDKLNTDLDVDYDEDDALARSFKNSHTSGLLALYNIVKPHIRQIEKKDLDKELNDFKKEIANRPPSVIKDLIEANDKRVQFANEVHDQTEHIKQERENQKQEYINDKLKEAEEQIKIQFENEYPDNTEDKISEYLQSVKDDLDKYSADFDNKTSEAEKQLIEQFKDRQDDESLNSIFDYLEQKATISEYAQSDIDNAHKQNQNMYALEEEDDDFDFDFDDNEIPNDSQQNNSNNADEDIVDIDKMMAEQPLEEDNQNEEEENISSSDGQEQEQNDDDVSSEQDDASFEDDDDPFGDAFDDDESEDDETLEEDPFDEDPILNEDVSEDTSNSEDENNDNSDNDEDHSFIQPLKEYETPEDEDDLLTEDVDEGKDIDGNIITASRADSTLNDDIESDKTEMTHDYESTTLQDDEDANKKDDKDKSEKKDDKKSMDEERPPTFSEMLKLDKLSKKTKKIIFITLASIVILAGIGGTVTAVIISNDDAHQEAKQKEEQKKEAAKKKRLDEIAKYMKGKKMRVVDKESQNRVVFTVTNITEKGGAKGYYYKTTKGDREKVEKYMSPEVVKEYVDRLKEQEKEDEGENAS